MEIIRIKVILLGFCSLGLSQDTSFTPFTEYLVGYRGQSVVLPCSTTLGDATLKWKVAERYLYNGFHVSDPSKYAVEGYDLTVRDLELGDAGTYQCLLVKNGNSLAITNVGNMTTELIVIDTDPNCSANVTSRTQLREGDLVGVTCLVSYLGKAYPVTQCHRTRSSEPLSTNQSSSAVNGTMVVTMVTIHVDFDLNNETLNCTTYFQLTSDITQLQNRSTRVPNYRHSWLSLRPNVISEPRNLRLDPESEYFYLGTTVRCVADANPPPSLTEWHNVVNGQVVVGDQLVIDKPTFSPGTFRYRCLVRNALGGNNSTFTISVQEEKSEVVTTVYWYSIGLPVIITILALVALTVALVVVNRNIRRKLMKQEQSKTCAELQFTGSDPSTDYDEIIDESVVAQSSITDSDPRDAQTDLQGAVDPTAIPPQGPNLFYTGLTGPRHTPRPSVYTALEHSGQPPASRSGDSTTTSVTRVSTASDRFTSEIYCAAGGSDDQPKPKSPQYVNQPLYFEVITE